MKKRLLALLLTGTLLAQSGLALAAEIDIEDISDEITEEEIVVTEDPVDASAPDVATEETESNENEAEETVQAITVNDDITGTCGDNLTWTLDSEGTLTISGTGAMTDWESYSLVPWGSNADMIKTVSIENGVTSIGKYAFDYCSNLTSVTIPNSVTSIGDYAFRSCGLTSITIPNSVKSIGDYAFDSCSSLTSVTIPNSVTSIGASAFYSCSNLESVTIPNSVTSIGDYAFEACSSLRSVTIPDSVTSIGESAFCYCSNLTSVTIPNSVTKIESWAFYKCEKLKDVYYLGTEAEWKAVSIEMGNSRLANATLHTHTHSWDSGKVTKAATCTATGVKTYTCTRCGATKTETIAKIAHTYKTTTTKAKPGTNGKIVSKCSCGSVKSTTTIYAPKTLTLSTTSYTYNGKTKKPTVKVKDSKGNTISSTHYTVSYASGRKYVGSYKVTVTFKGSKYSGSMSKTFVINPKATTLSSVTAASKGFTARWSKVTTQTTGYQLQYSTSSKFTSAKTVTITSNKTTSKKITKLTAKKKYYVRVRTYKTVSGKKYYSSWSSAKAVTTKK